MGYADDTGKALMKQYLSGEVEPDWRSYVTDGPSLLPGEVQCQATMLINNHRWRCTRAQHTKGVHRLRLEFYWQEPKIVTAQTNV